MRATFPNTMHLVLTISLYFSSLLCITKSSVFSHAVAFEVFAANPPLMKDAKFVKYLQSKTDPMPDYMINLLYLLKDEESFRTELESQMATLNTIKYETQDELLLAYASVGNDEEVLNLLDERNSTAGDIYLTEYYLTEDNTSMVNHYLSRLEDKTFVKDPVSTTEVEQFGRWVELYESIVDSNRDWTEVTSTERQLLDELAYQYFYTTAGKNAMAVLEEITDQSYFIPPFYGNSEGFSFRSSVNSENASLVPAGERKRVEVFPNPASYLVNIELDYTESLKTPSKLLIKDALGRLVHSELVINTKQIFSLNSSSWSSGTYYYELRNNQELINSGKIEIGH